MQDANANRACVQTSGNASARADGNSVVATVAGVDATATAGIQVAAQQIAETCLKMFVEKDLDKRKSPSLLVCSRIQVAKIASGAGSKTATSPDTPDALELNGRQSCNSC